MQTTTKAIFLLAALALLTMPAAVDAATATAAHADRSGGDSRVYCRDAPEPLRGPWRLACGTLAWICYTTDKCR